MPIKIVLSSTKICGGCGEDKSLIHYTPRRKGKGKGNGSISMRYEITNGMFKTTVESISMYQAVRELFGSRASLGDRGSGFVHISWQAKGGHGLSAPKICNLDTEDGMDPKPPPEPEQELS